MSTVRQTRIQAKARFKEMPCRECQRPMQVGSNTRNAPRCVECGIAASAAAIRQMHEKSGPAYGRWVMGMQLALERAYRTTGGE